MCMGHRDCYFEPAWYNQEDMVDSTKVDSTFYNFCKKRLFSQTILDQICYLFTYD